MLYGLNDNCLECIHGELCAVRGQKADLESQIERLVHSGEYSDIIRVSTDCKAFALPKVSPKNGKAVEV